MVDILSGAILQPVLDLIADPDIINYILEVSFSPEKRKEIPKASGKSVQILENFVDGSEYTSYSVRQENPQLFDAVF